MIVLNYIGSLVVWVVKAVCLFQELRNCILLFTFMVLFSKSWIIEYSLIKLLPATNSQWSFVTMA